MFVRKVNKVLNIINDMIKLKVVIFVVKVIIVLKALKIMKVMKVKIVGVKNCEDNFVRMKLYTQHPQLLEVKSMPPPTLILNNQVFPLSQQNKFCTEKFCALSCDK